MEAIVEGYSEGIALDTNGQISEGSGQNLFLVRDEVLYTPPLSAAVLPGITRDSIIQIARDLGFKVAEEPLPRELLYIADEAFFVGTAAEVTPIRSVDKITVGRGRRGPVTEAIQKAFFAIVNGETPDRHGWLTYVYPGEPLQAGRRRRRGGCGTQVASAESASTEVRAMHINDLLKTAVASGASDLHVKVGSYPVMRVNGALVVASEEKRLDRADTEAMAGAIMGAGARREVPEVPGGRPRLQRRRPRALPLQRLPAARHGRHRPARHSRSDPHRSTSSGCRPSSSRSPRRSAA